LPLIDSLEPFGAGNPQPTFGLYGMTVYNVQSIGGGKHMRVTVKKNEQTLTAVYFGVTPDKFPYKAGDVVDLAVRLERNEFMSQIKVGIYVKDIRMSGTDDLRYLKSVRLYEKMKRHEVLTQKQKEYLHITREEIAEVYRFIKKSGGWYGDTDLLCYRLGDDGAGACKVLTAIDILCELGIFRKEKDGIFCLDTSKKVNLENSSLMNYVNSMQ
jgi:single-stranded-DNA-specific exonuclease